MLGNTAELGQLTGRLDRVVRARIVSTLSVIDVIRITREAAMREWSLPKPPIWLMTPAV